MIRGKNILLGISGSIAAYKAAFLTRLLVKEGAHVRVVMTESACEFITPLTLSTLSKSPVISTFTEDSETGVWNNHVELGLWADVMIIVPATANTLARMSNGVCDDVLVAVYLSAKCPVWFAPAMDLDMYQHPSTKENIQKLQSFGNRMIQPGTGELASGLSGEGRMAEPEEILLAVQEHFGKGLPLQGKRITITAGPTHEPIDPVRYIGNRSTGKMGFALAEEAIARGAEVTLIAGPTVLSTPNGVHERVDVNTAAEMLKAGEDSFTNCDILIMSAAVADYTPAQVASQKMKKKDNDLRIELAPTADVLATLGKLKQPGQLLIGFALETENELEYAQGKLERKNLDMIVLNSLQDKGAGFGHDTNKVTLIDRQNKIEHLELKSKSDVAGDILDKVVTLL